MGTESEKKALRLKGVAAPSGRRAGLRPPRVGTHPQMGLERDEHIPGNPVL